MLRGAFIGFGNVAANGHMPGWRSRDDVRIVAATDAARRAGRRFSPPVPTAGGSRRSTICCLRERLDFVDVCAPPGSHAAIIGRALDAGLHVLSEKPLVTRVDDAARLAVGRRARGARPPYGPQLASCADLPEDLGADRRAARSAPSARCAGATLQDPAGDRRQRARRRQLARRSEARGRRHPVRSRLACALLRRPLGRRSGARLGAARDAPLPRPAARGHRDARLADGLRREPNLSHLGRRRALERDRDRRGAGRDPRRRRLCRPQIGVRRSAAGRSPSLSEGSHHPDWFGGVADDFLAAATRRRRRQSR